MLELFFSALLQLSLLADPSSAETSSLDAQTTASSSTGEGEESYGGGTSWDDNNYTGSGEPEPDPNYGGGTSWDDNN